MTNVETTPKPKTELSDKVKRRNKFLMIATVALFAIAIGFSMATDSNKAERAKKAYEEAPAINVTVAQLENDYEQNEVRADARYKGKKVRVRGYAGNIGVSLGTPFVLLTSDPENLLLGVHADIDKETAAKLDKGQVYTFVGVCRGNTINIILDDAHLE